MERPVYIQAGKIIKPFGNRGEVLLTVHENYADIIPETGHLFLHDDGSYLPFFVESWEGDEEALVKLEEIDSPEQASRYSGKTIFLSRQQVPQQKQRSQDMWLDITGYEAWNGDELLGPVTDVIEYPLQKLLKIEHKGREILIPFVEEFIIQMDPEVRKIILQVDDELLNL